MRTRRRPPIPRPAPAVHIPEPRKEDNINIERTKNGPALPNPDRMQAPSPKRRS